MSKKDCEIIYDGYLVAFEKYIQKKQYSPQKAKQKWQEKINSLGKALVYCGFGYMSATDKANIIRDTKVIYQEFCRCLKSDENSVSEADQARMYSLLKYVSGFEQEIVERYRCQLFAGEKLNLEVILADSEYYMQIAQRPIDKILDQYLYDTKNCTYLVQGDVYISETGKKFHKEHCPHCKAGQILKLVPQRLAENYGLEPCKCLSDSKESSFITAFIDESVRDNPWSDMEGVSGEKQSCYSYIICRGKLSSEKLITENNTLTKGAGLLDREVSSTGTAIEAIYNVLMKLAFIYEFNKNVIIYTDNKGAVCSWEQAEGNKYLSTLFEKVNVIFIPREENKVADRIGRQISFFDVPTNVMEKIIYKCKVYDEFARKII